MKVAICFSGQPRGFNLCIAKIKSHYIKPWGIMPTYYFYGPCAINYNIADVCSGIIVEHEEQSDNTVIDINMHGYQQGKKAFSWQWYNSKKSLEMALNSDIEYDAYVRIRTDIYPCGESTFKWSKFEPATLYLPEKLAWGGVCDRIGIGDRQTMSVYANFYGSHEFRNTYGNSETRLAAYLKTNNIQIKTVDNTVLDFCHKDENGIIRYPGPEIEYKLKVLDGEIVRDNEFCEIYWR